MQYCTGRLHAFENWFRLLTDPSNAEYTNFTVYHITLDSSPTGQPSATIIANVSNYPILVRHLQSEAELRSHLAHSPLFSHKQATLEIGMEAMEFVVQQTGVAGGRGVKNISGFSSIVHSNLSNLIFKYDWEYDNV